jgi:uncharacterized protein
MIEQNLFEIKKYDFKEGLLTKVVENHYVKSMWPLVYILSDGEIKEAYVGETTDALSRMTNHLKNISKNKLSSVHLITSSKFNKSATLDIESNLIKYLAGDGNFKLLNGNLGLANHTYYQKTEVYWDIFKTLWNELKTEGLTNNTLDQINNSDLFKYSPYKSLTIEQKNSLIEIIKALLNKRTHNIIVEGGAGTGKTILAIFLFKLLTLNQEDLFLKDLLDDENDFIKLINNLKKDYQNPSMALVVPMAGFRNTLKKVFRNIKGLNANMVIGPAEVTRQKFDILIVDESHRLRKRINLGTYFGAFDKANQRLNLNKEKGNELDWIINQSRKSILFYDENQTIKPSDVDKKDFDLLKMKSSTDIRTLKSQFRVKGGNGYVAFVDKLLNCKFREHENALEIKNYEFIIFDSLEEMINKIKLRNEQFGLSRLVAGYSWKWVSRNTNEHDILIDGIKLNWNSVTDDFINSENAINEVGCIHTTQGYDLNYTGVIFGKEISYDTDKGKIFIKPENYHDRNGQVGIANPDILHAFIINIYKTLMLRGIKGTYVYICDDNLKKYFKSVMEAKTENVVVKEITQKPILSPISIEMIQVPLVGSAPCGESILAHENIEEYIPVPKSKIKSGYQYFILQAEGDSMNLAGINDGDLVLCRLQEKADTGDRVVARLSNDNVTIKYYDKKNGKRILLPKSTNKEHKPIIPEEGDSVQGVVQEILKDDEFEIGTV